jgi:hypothetical protein
MRFGIEHQVDVGPRLPLWLEAFQSMNPEILEKLFIHAFKTCKFFPKVSEIIEPIQTAKEVSVPEAAERAWQQLLALRRSEWNPDMPNRLKDSLSKKSDRFQCAARSAGVFRDFESVDDLHTWAKKRFVESYISYDEREQCKYLLPEGEIRNMLSVLAEKKMLPGPKGS